MPKVKNISHVDVIIVESSRRGVHRVVHTIKPKCIQNVPLNHQLKHFLAEGHLVLVDGGEIVDFPGGIRYKRPNPRPPLRSVDDPWQS